MPDVEGDEATFFLDGKDGYLTYGDDLAPEHTLQLAVESVDDEHAQLALDDDITWYAAGEDVPRRARLTLRCRARITSLRP